MCVAVALKRVEIIYARACEPVLAVVGTGGAFVRAVARHGRACSVRLEESAPPAVSGVNSTEKTLLGAPPLSRSQCYRQKIWSTPPLRFCTCINYPPILRQIKESKSHPVDPSLYIGVSYFVTIQYVLVTSHHSRTG